MSALMAPVIKRFDDLFRPLKDLEIQPVDEQGNPATLAMIAYRVRYFRYMCPDCGGLVAAHVTATPHKNGVKVQPFPGKYRIKVPCFWCNTEHGLSDIIRFMTGGRGQ